MTCQTPPFPVFDTPSKTCLGKGLLYKDAVPRSSQREIERIYTKERAIPVIYGSQSSCEAMKTFFHYNKKQHPA